jgi:bifunctional non-homologous end joining protein LigD
MGLEEYRDKRDFGRTAEPAGLEHPEREARAGDDAGAARAYVIHKHAASRLHYDLRLQLDGVLKSWAIPKGPSLDPHDRRLAVHVEDHPLEYGSFEGVIPKGEYGGGTVMIWDRGTWAPWGKRSPQEDYEKGDFKFILHGEKLRGSYALVRMAHRSVGGDDESRENWLLIKHKDEEARPGEGDAAVQQLTESAATGRSMEAIAEEGSVWHSRRQVVDPAGVPDAVRGALPDMIEPELATLVKRPPSGEQWLHEIKFDGYRILSRVTAGEARLFTRRGLDWTERFASVARAVALLPAREAWFDGEVVALSKRGASSFSALQQALSAGRDEQIVYYVFDLLFLDGYDLRPAPLAERKSALVALLQGGAGGDAARVVRYSEDWRDGETLFEQACGLELEGVVSKRADKAYTSRRGGDWLKAKCLRRQEFVVGGYSDPEGARTGFGALLLGLYEADGRLSYCGRVGTGFDERTLASLSTRLRAFEQPEAPFAAAPRGAQARGVHWVRPELVAEVEFADWTGDGMIRHSSFRGLREDKRPPEVVREDAEAAGAGEAGAGEAGAARATASPAEPSAPASEPSAPAPGRAASPASERAASPAPANGDVMVAGVKLSHPDRIFYPGEGITKLELARYYERVDDWIMPHIRDRLLTLVRCPEGHETQCFFQKHADDSFPATIRRVTIPENGGSGTYFAIDSLAQLVWLVQMGGLEFHVWGSRVGDYEHPDELVFDLDPDVGLGWERVVAAARLLHDRLAQLGLASFVKTSGGKGLHVVVPIRPERSWDEAKAFCRALANHIVGERPLEYTATMSKAKREGRVFIDYLRNGRGATSVVAYSSRRRAGAPVSMPLRWDELSGLRSADSYTVRTALRRLSSLKADPWEGFAAAAGQSLPSLG